MEMLQLRSIITRSIREFFWSENFLEVDAPTIIQLPGQEPYLSPMKLEIHDEKNTSYSAYLHTSPEYSMKKMLASGFQNIFYLGKCFRDNESFGGLHNPEFTMLEWYRTNATMFDLMKDVQALWSVLIKNKVLHEARGTYHEAHVEVKHMREIWQEHVHVNLDDYLTTESLFQLCQKLNLLPRDTCLVPREEPYEDLFYRIFLNHIEPKLIAPTIIHHYPAQMAALAKLSDEDPRYAERFEVYINGMEIANAFTELTDADEQLRRLEEEQKLRKTLGKDVFPIDMEFIDAVKNLPPCAGIALGVDRLIQVLLSCQNIDTVIGLPASKIFDAYNQ